MIALRTARAGVLAAALMVATGTTSALATNDPGLSQQWALTGAPSSIHAPEAWCNGQGGVLVADIDSGANFSHEDLQGKLIPGNAYLGGNGDITGSGEAAVTDDNGHGSMTTGIMSAVTDNGKGIAGVAPASQALIVKVLKQDSSGEATGTANDVAAGIRWAADQPGVKVINLSLGPDVHVPLSGLTNPVPPAIHYAVGTRHVMVVAAAGNQSGQSSDYKSETDEALVVGATNHDGYKASYSQPGNIYAPGGDGDQPSDKTWVISTGSKSSTAYLMGAGTSLAAPQVAGTVALLMGNGMSAAQARQRVLDTAVSRNGVRQLDAAAALGSSGCAASQAPPPSGHLNTAPTKKTTVAPKTPAASPPPPPPPSPSPEPSPTPSRLFGVVPDEGPD
ncbi:MAG: thermitase, partial [Chloroflexota bacterium]|nr:thermitase [Chloroflexota bacterium]